MRTKRTRRNVSWSWLRRAIIGMAVCIAVGAVSLAVLLWYYTRDLPTVASLRSYRPPQTTRVLDRRGALIGELYTERRTVVPMKRIPRVLVLSILAAEDADFYEHEGLDYPGILRAIVRDVLAGRPAQGASTITQQVVKLMLLSPERTLARKLRELVLARRLEQELSKDEILFLYLNHINFGHGRYGAQEASRYYFAKDVDDIGLSEAALLAGLPQSPGRLSPRAHPEAARRRQLFVLDQLESKRARYWPDLSSERIAEARQQPIELAPAIQSDMGAPEVLAAVGASLREEVGDEAYARGGYTVHTTFDLRLQKKVRAALRSGLEAVDRRNGFRGPLKAPTRPTKRIERVEALAMGRTYEAVVRSVDNASNQLTIDVGGHAAFIDLRKAERYNPSHLAANAFAEPGARFRVSIVALPDTSSGDQKAEAQLELGPEGAVVVIDPRTRDVLSLVGSYHARAGFNRATQAVRQPGSAFKPIVYAFGIHTGRFTPASLVIDAPAVYDRWRPHNAETWNYEGAVRLRDALARSINLVAVRVIEDLTPEKVVEFAQALGITTTLDPSLALALGASDVRPIELVNAYATFAAGGRFEQPRFLTRIEGPDGREIKTPRGQSTAPMTQAEAYVITNMLKSVIEGGTGAGGRRLQRPAAGKTGTSNDARDTWFVGYTPNVVAGVWVGFDDRRPLGRRENGGRTALPIWVDVMKAAENDRPVVDFPLPSGVVTARIDPQTGLLAYEGMPTGVDEVFVEGTAPTQVARSPDVADPDTFMMEQFGSGSTPTGTTPLQEATP